jgi:uncharacterized protein YcfJ
MTKTLLAATALLTLAASGAYAQSSAGQGATGGAAAGAATGAIVGGPVGAAVGAGVGATAGAVAGGLSDAERPRFRQYVTSRNVPSYRYTEEVRVGTTLPADGVTYYEVPAEYGVRNYRYTVVNNRTVLVDPGTRRVVQVVE